MTRKPQGSRSRRAMRGGRAKRETPQENLVTREADLRTAIHVYAWSGWGFLSLAAEQAQGTPYEASVRAAMAAAEQVMGQLEADAAAADHELRRPEPYW